MAKKDTKQVKNEEVKNTFEVVTPDDSLLPPESIPPEQVTFKQGIAPYVVFLEAMRTTKKHIDTAPTFTPKNFYDQIQFYDDGAVRRIYLYINATWRYVALT